MKCPSLCIRQIHLLKLSTRRRGDLLTVDKYLQVANLHTMVNRKIPARQLIPRKTYMHVVAMS